MQAEPHDERAVERARMNRWLRGRMDFRGQGLEVCVCGLFHPRTDGPRCRYCQQEAEGKRRG